MDQKEKEDQVIHFARTNGKNNPKPNNLEELRLFEYAATERGTRQRYECYQGKW